MKKFFLSVFVLAVTLTTLSCNKDDDNNGDNGGGNQAQLIVTIDGQELTFDSIIVDRYDYTDDGGGTELDITATIGGGTGRIITFYTYVGDTGANAIYNFGYTLNGVYYSGFNNFVSVTNVNNGSRLEVNFSGTLGGYDEVNQEEIFVTLENGTIAVDF
ncbi:hypothetical protein [Psychroserpens sp.]|uniref:hypothetical protein n=1 Tax=Psychroserpens sp. TaxID=2020870 RepID=UPI002B268528|nr:hypothetical protein [Psychroserpens sp.]